jgi:DEAD/DEAH box helicase
LAGLNNPKEETSGDSGAELTADVKPVADKPKGKKMKRSAADKITPGSENEGITISIDAANSSVGDKAGKIFHQRIIEPTFDTWNGIYLHTQLASALHSLKFTQPTPIQVKAIPEIMKARADVVGAAETGSGKTLAFLMYAIPVKY